MKSYKKIDFTEKNKPYKRFTQTLLYKTSKVKGNSLLLCGPNLKSHIKDAEIITRYTTGSINIYEISKDTYLLNLKEKSKIKSSVPVNIINNNILEALKNKKIYRFIDLDLCSILTTNINTIKTTFNYLNNLKGKSKNLNKHILVTFCGITTKRKTDIKTLCNIFGIKNDFIKDDFLPKVCLYKSKTSDACYINYRDGIPMCTFSYQFK